MTFIRTGKGYRLREGVEAAMGVCSSSTALRTSAPSAVKN